MLGVLRIALADGSIEAAVIILYLSNYFAASRCLRFTAFFISLACRINYELLPLSWKHVRLFVRMLLLSCGDLKKLAELAVFTALLCREM